MEIDKINNYIKQNFGTNQADISKSSNGKMDLGKIVQQVTKSKGNIGYGGIKLWFRNCIILSGLFM